MTPKDLERLISPARFATFVKLTSGDRVAAARLYTWTGELAGAFFTDFRQVEVIFRNRVDQALAAYSHSQDPSIISWLDDTWVPPKANRWDKGAKDAIKTATRRVHSSSPSHDAVIAQLTFAFWRFTISGRYEEAFWLPALDSAFTNIPGPVAVDRRQALEQSMINLSNFRNRLAHHEPICKPSSRRGPNGTKLILSVEDVHRDLMNVLRWTDQDACSEIKSESRVRALLARRPV